MQMYGGRQAKLPIEMAMNPHNRDDDDERESNTETEENELEINDDDDIRDVSFDDRTSQIIQMRRETLKNIEIAQQRQKKHYDAKHSLDKPKYKVEASVWLKNSKKLTRKGPKMEPNWTGPYLINEVKTKGTFRLREVGKKNPKVLKQLMVCLSQTLFLRPKLKKIALEQRI